MRHHDGEVIDGIWINGDRVDTATLTVHMDGLGEGISQNATTFPGEDRDKVYQYVN